MTIGHKTKIGAPTKVEAPILLLREKPRLNYQLDLVTPGIFPARAISRKRTRLMPNLRM